MSATRASWRMTAGQPDGLFLRFSGRWVMLGLIGCSLFTWASLLLQQDGDFRLIGLGGTIYFGFHSLLWACMLRPGAGLELNRRGLILRAGFRTVSYAWQEIACFHVVGGDSPRHLGLSAPSTFCATPPIHARLQVFNPNGFGHGICFLSFSYTVFIEPDLFCRLAFLKE